METAKPGGYGNSRTHFGKVVPERRVMQTKEQILKAIEELPDDATFEDALERLYLLYSSKVDS